MKISKRYRRLFLRFCVFLLGFIMIFTLGIHASEEIEDKYDYEKIPNEYTELLDELPSDISSDIPDDMLQIINK